MSWNSEIGRCHFISLDRISTFVRLSDVFFLLFSSMHFVCYFSFSRNRNPEFISLAIFRDTLVNVCLCTRVSLCHTASVCIFLIGQRHKKCSEITTQLSFWIKLNGICFGRTSKRKPEKRHTLTR